MEPSRRSLAPAKERHWINHGCRQVVLPDSELTSLTESERAAIRQLALVKLKALNLGCQINPPKGNNNDKVGSQVFGVPLAVCCRQESADSHQIQRSHSTSVDDLTRARHNIGRSGSQVSLTYYLDSRENEKIAREKTPSCESLNTESFKQRVFPELSKLNSSSSELEINLSRNPQVPEIANMCFRHLENFGLNTFGIFRVGSSKKRVRQLREDFDSGKITELNRHHCPHDVAALLKQYFRDLPEPLLTRELYPVFIATQKVCNRKHQIEALRYLIQLLPSPNCDTLHALLQFLSKVAVNSEDHISSSGEKMFGNKMNSTNLATLFGPNVLHTVKGGAAVDREFVVLASSRADERIDVISAVKTMIDNTKALFHVPSEQLHETYLSLLDRKPEVVEHLLNVRSGLTEIDVDFDTSSSQLEGTDTSLSASPSTERLSSGSSAKKDPSPPSESPAKTSEKSSIGLFRRREKSATPDPEGKSRRSRKTNDEEANTGSSSIISSRWFRRRERSKTSETATNSQDSDKKGRRRRDVSPSSKQRPLSVQQQQVSVVTIRRQEQRLSVPDIRRPNRRLSSSDVPESSSVISASLTLRVPAALQMDDRDIPYIEDAMQPDQEMMEFVSRRYEKRLSYPTTVNMKTTHRSQDSVLSSEGGSSFSGESPSNLRHTPSSDMGCVSASGGSTPLSSSSPPPPVWQHSHSVPASPRTSPANRRYSRQEKRRLSGVRGSNEKINWGNEAVWKRWEIIASEHTETDNAISLNLVAPSASANKRYSPLALSKP
uniref:Rho-GAP domain-containing protein n=1 Tax=Strigamia maritima TaxID=126957 RepID=T1JCG3_STRMM